MAKTTESSFKGLPLDQKPREKLLRTGNTAELSDEDLLAIILRTGVKGCDVWELAHRILCVFSSLDELVRADARTIDTRIGEYNLKNPDRPVKGVGAAKLVELQAAFELTRRANRLAQVEFRAKNLKSSSAAYHVFRKIVGDAPECEMFFVLPMDSDFHPLCDPIVVSKGTADRTIVHPRDVFREAVRWNAYSIIIAHNHPCGDPVPSEEDIELTKKLIEIGRLHHIPILDHIVLGASESANGRGFVSIRNLAIMKF